MECPVCIEIYDTPLLLPGCGHTLCKSCAQKLISSDNFLRCPECRLVYQLRQGIKSLPKNVALERMIDEAGFPNSRLLRTMCDEHPDDSATLYCKTCDKSICLKCYFSNTIERRPLSHINHDVDTSDDAFSKEKRILDDKKRIFLEKRNNERNYIDDLERVDCKLKALLHEKINEIEKNQNEIILKVKQASNKLKYTLKGSVAKDEEKMKTVINLATERLDYLFNIVDETDEILINAAVGDQQELMTLKNAVKKLNDYQEPSEIEKPSSDYFLKISSFNTDVWSCINDQKKALSYQTEIPRVPIIKEEECVISSASVYISIIYKETVRVKTLNIYYKESLFKGLSEKKWSHQEINNLGHGKAGVVIKGLTQGSLYRLYCIASNNVGDSSQSNEIWFRTMDGNSEIRST